MSKRVTVASPGGKKKKSGLKKKKLKKKSDAKAFAKRYGEVAGQKGIDIELVSRDDMAGAPLSDRSGNPEMRAPPNVAAAAAAAAAAPAGAPGSLAQSREQRLLDATLERYHLAHMSGTNVTEHEAERELTRLCICLQYLIDTKKLPKIIAQKQKIAQKRNQKQARATGHLDKDALSAALNRRTSMASSGIDRMPTIHDDDDTASVASGRDLPQLSARRSNGGDDDNKEMKSPGRTVTDSSFTTFGGDGSSGGTQYSQTSVLTKTVTETGGKDKDKKKKKEKKSNLSFGSSIAIMTKATPTGKPRVAATLLAEVDASISGENKLARQGSSDSLQSGNSDPMEKINEEGEAENNPLRQDTVGSQSDLDLAKADEQKSKSFMKLARGHQTFLGLMSSASPTVPSKSSKKYLLPDKATVDETIKKQSNVFEDRFFHESVTERMLQMEYTRFNQIWDDCELEGDDMVVSEFEASMYEQIIQVLVTKAQQQEAEFIKTQKAKAKKDRKYLDMPQDALLTQFYWRLLNVLATLRQMETEPNTFHNGGFLMRVDNVCAILLYRRKAENEKETNAIKTQIEKEAEEKQTLDKAEYDLFMERVANKCKLPRAASFTLYGLLAICVVTIGIFIIWDSWRLAGLQAVDDAHSALSYHYQDHASFFTAEHVNQAIKARDLIRPHMATLNNVADLVDGGNPTPWEKAMLNVMESLHVKAVSFTSGITSAYLAVYRLGDASGDYSKPPFASSDAWTSQTFRILSATSSSVFQQYPVNTTTNTRIEDPAVVSCFNTLDTAASEPECVGFLYGDSSFTDTNTTTDGVHKPNWKTSLKSLFEKGESQKQLLLRYSWPAYNSVGSYIGVWSVDLSFNDVSAQLRSSLTGFEDTVVMVVDENVNLMASSSATAGVDKLGSTVFETSNKLAGTVLKALRDTDSNLRDTVLLASRRTSFGGVVGQFASLKNTKFWQSSLLFSDPASSLGGSFDKWIVVSAVSTGTLSAFADGQLGNSWGVGVVAIFSAISMTVFACIMARKRKTTKLEEDTVALADTLASVVPVTPDGDEPTSPGSAKSQASLRRVGATRPAFKAAGKAIVTVMRSVGVTVSQFFILIAFLVIVMCVFLVWALWTRASNHRLSSVTDVLITQGHSRALDLADASIVSSLQLLASLVRSYASSQTFFQPGELTRALGAWLVFGSAFGGEYVFYGTEATGDLAGAKYFNTSSTVSNPEFRWDNGVNYGIYPDNNSTTTSPHTLLVGEATSSCYKLYASRPASLTSLDTSFIKDGARIIYPISGCGSSHFDARSRPWYTNVKRKVVNGMTAANATWSITAPYHFVSTGALGVTVSYPLFSTTTGALNGVVGVDITLAALSSWLQKVPRNNDPDASATNAVLFFADVSTKTLLASDSQTDADFTQSLGTTPPATTTLDTTTQDVAAFLDNIGFNTFGNTPTPFDRGMSEYLTSAKSTKADTSFDFVLGSGLPDDDYQDRFVHQLDVPFLLCLGVLLFVVYLLVSPFSVFHVQIVKQETLGELEVKHTKLLQRMGGQHVSKKVLISIMRRIRPDVINACAHVWRRAIYNTKSMPVTKFDTMRAHYCNQAIRHIEDSRRNRNVLTMCALETQSQSLDEKYDPSKDSPWPGRYYRLVTNQLYRAVSYTIIIIHVLLVLVKPSSIQSARDNGYPQWVLGVEAICIIWEVIDYIIVSWVTYGYRISNFLKQERSLILDVFYFFLLALIAFDWVLEVSTSFSIEFYVPVRPILLVLRVEQVREAAQSFVSTLLTQRDVFLLYFLVVFVAALIGLVMFRERFNAGVPESSYATLIRSFVTTFVFFSTADNYPDVIYPSTSYSPWYAIYYVVFAFVGFFAMMAMVIGAFQDGFGDVRKDKLKQEQLFNRVGSIAAFILMDLDGSEALSFEEFEYFLVTLRPTITTEMAYEVFRKSDFTNSGTVDIAEFTVGIEDIVYNRYIQENQHREPNKVLDALRIHIFERSWYQKVILILVFANLWVLSFYGTYRNETLLDILGGGILIFFVLEVALRVMSYGFEEYWNYAKYHGPKEKLSEEESKENEILQKVQEMALSGNEENQAAADADEEHASITLESSLPPPPEWKEEEQLETTGSHGYKKKTNIIRKQSSGVKKEKSTPGGPVTAASLHATIAQEDVEDRLMEMERRRKKQANRVNIYRMYANRYDLALMVACSVAFVATRIAVGSFWFDSSNDTLRFAVSFQALRIFSAMPRVRPITFTFISSFPRVSPIGVLLLIVFYQYAVIGTFLFKNQFTYFTNADGVFGNFDNFPNAMLVLFQMMLGQAWSGGMWASVRANRSFGVAWYYMSFVFLVTMLFVNALLSIILDNFQEMFKREREQRVFEKRRQLELRLAKKRLATLLE